MQYKVNQSQPDAMASETIKSGSEFSRTEEQIHRACDQMTLIYDQIVQIQTRLSRAERDQLDHFTGPLKLKLQVLQGVYNAFHLYTSHKVEALMQYECWSYIN